MKRGRLPTLVQITPEGRILGALCEGPKGYGQLKSITGLSDRWLSKKLKELSSMRFVERHGESYKLTKPSRIVDADPLFARYLQMKASLKVKARLIADEIADKDGVVAVVLFGSVAKGEEKEESDIDLLIVTEREMEDHLNKIVYDLMFKYDVPLEAIFQTYDDMITSLQAKTSFSFGLLEGYEVLYDRGGVEGLLDIKSKEIRENWVYDKEAGAWIQKKLISTLKPLKSS